MYRTIVFAALLGGVGLGAWSSFSAPLKPPGLDFSALAAVLQEHLVLHTADKTEQVETADAQEGERAILLNAALSDGNAANLSAAIQSSDLPITSEPAAPQETCGAWNISEVGMEAILQEMIRRGWTPPARSKALAVSQSADLPPLEALDPDAPATPIFSATDGNERDLVKEPSQLTN